MSVDALGNPLRFRLTGGQRHDLTQAAALVAELDFERLIADRGYDDVQFIAELEAQDTEVVIPPRRWRLEQRTYDAHWYKERHLAECFFNKIKHFRRIFSRFEKLAQRYLGFLSFVSTLIWLR